MMSENKVKVPTTSEIQETWTNFSPGYSAYMAKNFQTIGVQMFNLVGGQQAQTVYDLGCGDGTLAIDFCLMKKEGAKLFCSDLVADMCKVVAGRFDRLSHMLAQGKLLGYKSVIATPVDTSKIEWSSSTSKTWPDLNVELFQADNEDLTIFMPTAG